jgi:hypothetical protein
MSVLAALPILGGLAVFQYAILSRIPLIMGTADVLLLAVIAWSLQERVETAWQWSVIGGFLASLGSGLTFGVLIGSYLVITGVALVVRRRVWKRPILAMFWMTIVGTLIVHLSSLVVRLLSGVTIPIVDAFNLITLPSLLLNVMLAIPIYLFMTDLAKLIYREEIKV